MHRLPPLPAWIALKADPALVAAAAAVDATDVAAVERLRRGRDLEEVAAALTLAEARRRGATKFPGLTDLWADVHGVQQASSAAVATWKAHRFRARGGRSRPSLDLCCGIGGDAMALADGGAALTAVDRSDVRAWMAGQNARCATLVADAGTVPVAGTLIHLDPARRDEAGGRRRHDLAGYEPSFEACAALARQADGACLKLGPGIPLPLPIDATATELEFISERGSLVQAVLWTGDLVDAAGRRTATMIDAAGAAITLTGQPSQPAVGAEASPGGVLLVPDPALERSELLGLLAGSLGLAELAPGLGILAAREPPASPWLRAYRIVATPKPREADVRAVLEELGAAGARVRTRGQSVDADAWTKALRGPGTGELDVFVLRVGQALRAFVCAGPPSSAR